MSSRRSGGRKGGKKEKHIEEKPSDASTSTESESGSSEAETLPAGIDCVLIDGSLKEGGGQVLRNATSLSAILHKPIKIMNIRAGRAKPGLAAQHLKGIELVRDMYAAYLSGNKIGSTSITFVPGEFRVAKQYEADPKTAGSIGLLAQVSLPCLLFAPQVVPVVLRGGTNVTHSPQIEYLMHVFRPNARHFGIAFDIDVERKGYYPQGGGEVHLHVTPVRSLSPISLTDRGTIKQIYIRSFVSGTVPIDVAHRMSQAARHSIRRHLGGTDDVEFEIENVAEPRAKSFGNGAGCIAIARTTTGCILAGSGLGEIGKRAEVVGEEAGESLAGDLATGGCVDKYMQDQLIIFMALAKGTSRLRTGPLELHTETSIHFSELLTGAKFTVTKAEAGQSYLIECEGIGFTNKYLNEAVA